MNDARQQCGPDRPGFVSGANCVIVRQFTTGARVLPSVGRMADMLGIAPQVNRPQGSP